MSQNTQEKTSNKDPYKITNTDNSGDPAYPVVSQDPEWRNLSIHLQESA